MKALIQGSISQMNRIPDDLIALIGRFSIAAIFWLSGQTKISGFKLNFVDGIYEFGLPSMNPSTFMLFEYEYDLPLIPPDLAAYLATFAEHLLPVLLLLGLATRFSALALLLMTLVIQIFVYPSAYPTHGIWLAVLLFLMAKGGGRLSMDHLIWKR